MNANTRPQTCIDSNNITELKVIIARLEAELEAEKVQKQYIQKILDDNKAKEVEEALRKREAASQRRSDKIAADLQKAEVELKKQQLKEKDDEKIRHEVEENRKVKAREELIKALLIAVGSIATAVGLYYKATK